MKKMLNISIDEGKVQIKITMRYTPSSVYTPPVSVYTTDTRPVRMAVIKKIRDDKCW